MQLQENKTETRRRRMKVSEAERRKEGRKKERFFSLSSHRLINPMMPGDQFKL